METVINLGSEADEQTDSLYFSKADDTNAKDKWRNGWRWFVATS